MTAMMSTQKQECKPLKIVIVGGVAGGASAAARARRLDEKAHIVLLQSGPDVSFASCGMPYYVGGEITDRSAMAVQTPESLREKLNLDVRVNTRVIAISIATEDDNNNNNKNTTTTNDDNNNSNYSNKKIVTARNETTGKEYTESYDELILAVGAAPFKPNIPGIDRPGLFTLRSLQDMDAIVRWIEKKSSSTLSTGTTDAPHGMADLHFVVAGAGFVGLEMVEQLVHRGANVTLVELMPQIMAPFDVEMAAMLQRDLEEKGVEVILGDGIASFDAYDRDPEASVVTLSSGRVLPPAHMTILGLGVRPDTEVIQRAGIVTTSRGHIQVDDHLRTSAPHVWAVGDAVEVRNPLLEGEMWAVPLAGPANRQGRMVADNIMTMTRSRNRDEATTKLRSYKGTYGTSVVRSFKLYAACVGMNEKLLVAKKIPHSCVHIHPGSHAGYYPGAKQVHLKLIFDPISGKIYGSQAVGEDGVEKRIDVIATAMQGRMTVDDLAELELCYAPPVGSAKDVVNMAGMAAQNIVEGLVSQVQWSDVERLSNDPGTILLDVRNPGEIQKSGKLSPGAMNIPLPNLRSQLDELPKDKHLVVSCASGQRAYYACRILKQNGFEHVDNLAGAFATFHAVHPDHAA